MNANYKNVKIESSTILESEGKYYNLHNDADFNGIKYYVSINEVHLIWKYPGQWVIDNPDTYSGDYLISNNITFEKKSFIALIFIGVDKLTMFSAENNIFENDLSLFEIEIIENLNTLIFRFGSGREISIKSEKVLFQHDYKL